MAYDYETYRMLITFHDAAGNKIAEHDYNLKSEDLNLPAMSPAHRVELDHEGQTLIGTVADVKHVMAADGSNNFTHSLQVLCTNSHIP